MSKGKGKGKDVVETKLMTPMVRAMELVPSTFDAVARTVDVVWTTGAKVRRYDDWNDRYYDEELVVSPEAVDMSRLNAGASVLNTHSQWDLSNVIGVVERAWLEGNEGRATVKLSQREDLAGVMPWCAPGSETTGARWRCIGPSAGRLPRFRLYLFLRTLAAACARSRHRARVSLVSL